jgi:hypothetical protein
MNIDAEICLVDQFDNPYPSKVRLIVERYAQEGKHAKKGDGLYAPKVFGTVSSPSPKSMHIHERTRQNSQRRGGEHG